MTTALLLQLFLGLNILLIVVLGGIAAWHGYAHYQQRRAKHSNFELTPEETELSPKVKAHLIGTAEAHFEAVLKHVAGEMELELKNTATQLNDRLDKLGTKIVDHEMERYQDSLEKLRKQTEEAISGAQDEITEHQKELKAKLTEHEVKLKVRLTKEVNVEKEKLLKQIDTKLGDAAVSFIIDTLQHNIDLGAQTQYLTETLEEHKEDFKREVDDGAPIAK